MRGCVFDYSTDSVVRDREKGHRYREPFCGDRQTNSFDLIKTSGMILGFLMKTEHGNVTSALGRQETLFTRETTAAPLCQCVCVCVCVGGCMYVCSSGSVSMCE